MKACIGWLLCLGILALNFAAEAANHYVRSGAAGNGSGSDWTNAYPSLPSTLVRGDTYYIADGTYGSYAFNTPLSGSSYIYIKKATITSHGSDTGWNNSYGDGEALFTSSGLLWTIQTGFLDIDGQRGTGKSPGAYGFRLYSTRDRCTGGDHIVYTGSITNLAIRHVDFDWNNGTSACNTATTVSIETDLNTSDNVTIENNYFHHSSGFALYLGNYTDHPVQSHYSIKNNYFYFNGGGGGPTSHWELMWLTDLHNSDIANNIFEDTYGTVDAQTGWLMFGRADTVNIYGNLFFCSTNCAVGGNGVIAAWSSDMWQNNAIHIYNNTFANLSGGYGPKIYFWHATVADTDIQVKNNLYYNSSFSWTGVTAQNNEACGGGQVCAGTNQQTGFTSTIFNNYAGYDFRLASATLAGDQSIGPQFSIDMNNVIRGADGVWDRGAYEFVKGGQATVLSAPKNLRVTN
ncbi:MAG: hypothetical protein ACXVCP_04570 [Bdellovibrio sp.]